MKIKVKKEMRLDELIKWARENPELSQGKKYCTTGESVEAVCFQKDTNKCFTIGGFTTIDATFTVEYEEEVTKDTVFDRLFEVYEIEEGFYGTVSHTSISVNELLDYPLAPTKAPYILNDDLTMTLIWKDGELVE
ncbi:TPA: hypothetical protein ACKW3Q_002583 [Staphylococcus aureus]